MSISTPNAISTPNTSPTITTDALIIGFGKGGKTLAAKLSAAGRKVVVAEASADMYGGTCINIGCLPSKSLILSAEQARQELGIVLQHGNRRAEIGKHRGKLKSNES